ncbi:hypothetical protein AB1N83_009745 [Pleurotus pulmonarius]
MRTRGRRLPMLMRTRNVSCMLCSQIFIVIRVFNISMNTSYQPNLPLASAVLMPLPVVGSQDQKPFAFRSAANRFPDQPFIAASPNDLRDVEHVDRPPKRHASCIIRFMLADASMIEGPPQTARVYPDSS